MQETRSDAQIIARASTEPELFGLVFDRHFAAIHRYLERRVGRDAADDLTGEVFRIAFEQRSRFRPAHSSALPWLYGLATKLTLKRWRGETRYRRAVHRLDRPSSNGHGAELEEISDRIAAQAARPRVLDALARLSAGDRDVVVLVAWEELSYEEVAVALEIPVGTVRSRLNRARRMLREALAELGEPATLEVELRKGVLDNG
jgi:RNA polymerase sigma factor (sigma-70 family)